VVARLFRPLPHQNWRRWVWRHFGWKTSWIDEIGLIWSVSEMIRLWGTRKMKSWKWRERIEGKRWEQGVLILMRGETSRGADVVDMRWRRGILDASDVMGSEDEVVMSLGTWYW
jgi:hypothetical protein